MYTRLIFAQNLRTN